MCNYKNVRYNNTHRQYMQDRPTEKVRKAHAITVEKLTPRAMPAAGGAGAGAFGGPGPIRSKIASSVQCVQ